MVFPKPFKVATKMGPYPQKSTQVPRSRCKKMPQRQRLPQLGVWGGEGNPGPVIMIDHQSNSQLLSGVIYIYIYITHKYPWCTIAACACVCGCVRTYTCVYIYIYCIFFLNITCIHTLTLTHTCWLSVRLANAWGVHTLASRSLRGHTLKSADPPTGSGVPGSQ